MKIRDLDGNSYTWKIAGNIVRSNEQRPRSKLHLKARQLLRDLYPALQIMEEVSFQLRRNQSGFLDFYINTVKTVIEVHGSQHYKFNTLYHTSIHDFINQKKRDVALVDWCELNNLTYVELPFNESVEEWKLRIQPQTS